MDTELQAKFERLTAAYNALSEQFIKFSLAYDAVLRHSTDQPDLFTSEKEEHAQAHPDVR